LPEASDTCDAFVAGSVDAHVHVFLPDMVRDRSAYLSGDERFRTLYSSPEARMVTAQEVLAQMDESGVERSVIFGFAFSDLGLCRETNDHVLQALKDHPDRFTGLACVPWGSPGAQTELDRCLRAGMHGCGELAPLSGDHEEFEELAPVAALLRESDLPLLLHASEPVGHQYPGKGRFTPEACVALAARYPGLKLVLAHLGGGTFLYETMPEGRRVLADVYYDTAAIPYLYSPEIYQIAVLAVGAEKLVFGSDYPVLDPVRCAQGVERLSPEDRQAIRADNAKRVFSL
jgi:hypothetical protein